MIKLKLQKQDPSWKKTGIILKKQQQLFKYNICTFYDTVS